MPDSTGLNSLLALIKTNPRTPIVIYSGETDTKIALEAITLGAQDFLIKGDYTVSLLEKTVRYSIERKCNSIALEESNMRYNFVSRATHDMVWDFDLITGEVHKNTEGWRKIFRTPDSQEIGTKEDWRLKIHPDDLEEVNQRLNDILKSATQESFEMECRILRDDGTIGCIENRCFIYRNEKGKAVRLIGATQDITEKKNAEQKVVLREQRFRSLVHNGPDLIGIIDKRGNYRHAGGSIKRFSGYTSDLIANKTPFAFIHPDDWVIIKKALSDIHTQTSIKATPYRFVNAAGEWRWMETIFTNLLNDPEVNGIIANSRDITENKLATDEIEKLSLLAKETINGVVISDKDQNIVWVNNAFTRLSGYTLKEVIGKCCVQFLQGPETDVEVINYVKEKTKQKDPFVFEILNYTKAGEKVLVKVQVQAILDEQGEVKQFFLLQTDITKERELEEKVEIEKILKQKQITEAVFDAHESERLEIGRELHDNVNQLLSAARLYIDMAKSDAEIRDTLLKDASAFTLSAIEEIRKLSKTLIIPSIKEISLTDSIKDITNEIMQVYPIQIFVNSKSSTEKELNDKFKLNIFRIVQEQINNILKVE